MLAANIYSQFLSKSVLLPTKGRRKPLEPMVMAVLPGEREKKEEAYSTR
jgi:hypothetical protein